MKRMITSFLILLIIAGIIAGCTGAGAASVSEEPEQPQNYTEIYGKVKAANGNEITLALGTMPGFGQNMPSSTGEGGEATDFPSFSDAGIPPSGRSGEGMPSGAGMPSGGQGGQRRNSGTVSGGNTTATSLRYTGEEITYQIPVTASVTTGEGDTARIVSFTQIAYKNILKLTLNEDGGIVAVTILQ